MILLPSGKRVAMYSMEGEHILPYNYERIKRDFDAQDMSNRCWVNIYYEMGDDTKVRMDGIAFYSKESAEEYGRENSEMNPELEFVKSVKVKW